jgi:hypothetical protein
VSGLRWQRSLWLGHEILLWLDRLDTPSRGVGRRKDTEFADLVTTDTLYAQFVDLGMSELQYFPAARGTG